MHTPITTARAAKTPIKHIPLKQNLNKVVLLLSYHYCLDYSVLKIADIVSNIWPNDLYKQKIITLSHMLFNSTLYRA